MKTLIYLFLIITSTTSLLSQSTPQPTPTAGINTTYFEPRSNSYIFTYSNDGNEVLRYKYSLNVNDGGACLHALTVTVNGTYTYWPSVGGGVALLDLNDENSDTVWAWESFNSHILLSSSLIDNEVLLHWKTVYDSKYFYYTYRMRIEGRTLILNIVQDEDQTENNVVQFNLDRSYTDPFVNSKSAYIIGVPYLTLFNILYNGDKLDVKNQDNVFTSMFFDWTSTGCSRLEVLNENFDAYSKRYSQFAVYNQKTNTLRNRLSERIYLTVSPTIDETFPNIPNPVSSHRDESVNRVVWDLWSDFVWENAYLNTINPFIINNSLWLIVHNWQRDGYDVSYPDVLPIRQCAIGYGQNNFDILRNTASIKNALFSMHENYVDYDPHSSNSYFNQNDMVLNSQSEPIPSYCFEDRKVLCGDVTERKIPSFCTGVLNASKMSSYYDGLSISKSIHSDYQTNASYLDVHSSYDPSIYVDYDASETNAGMFREVLKQNQDIATFERNTHEGPVSGEGLAHFLYAGYYDDFEAQLHTGQSLPGMHYRHTNSKEVYGGIAKPLLINFDLNKIREKTFSHGMGYFERFFYGIQNSGRYDREKVLTYFATTLAYGHGACIPPLFTVDSIYYIDVVKDIYNHVYSMQQLYGNATMKSITYNDNGVMIDATDYIKKHPESYNCFLNDEVSNNDFMGQVCVSYFSPTYGNIYVFVNRHPQKKWIVTDLPGSGWYNYHTTSGLYYGTSSQLSYELPPNSGWVCYSQTAPVLDNTFKKSGVKSPYVFRLSQNYPNPFNPITEIGYEIAKEVSVNIKIYNILGQLVSTIVNEVKKPGIYKTAFDGRNFASGVYFYKIEAGDFVERKKMVLIK